MFKYAGQKFLSFVPFRLGWRAHDWLRRQFGGLKSPTIYAFSQVLIMASLLERVGFDLKGKTLVELGTGWDAAGALTAIALGAERVDTFDQERRLQDALVSQAEHLIANPQAFYKQEKLPFAPAYDAVLRCLDVNRLADNRLRYLAPADARSTQLQGSSVDLYFSLAVLEHVPLPELEEIVAESFRILVPGGYCYHYVQPTMHAAWIDNAALGIDYLRFSEFWWRTLFSNSISFENRLRAPEYRQFLLRGGFRLVGEWHTVDQDSLRALPSTPIAPEFKKWSDEELATDFVWLIGQKPTA